MQITDIRKHNIYQKNIYFGQVWSMYPVSSNAMLSGTHTYYLPASFIFHSHNYVFINQMMIGSVNCEHQMLNVAIWVHSVVVYLVWGKQ